jgi:hypothetical protein
MSGENSISSTSDNDDELVLTEFFRQATSVLDITSPESEIDHYLSSSSSSLPSLHEIRTLILTKQTECLQASIDRCVIVVHKDTNHEIYTVQRLQNALRNCSQQPNLYSSSVWNDMARMNDAARLAFCRLVLCAEVLWDIVPASESQSSSSSSRRDATRHRVLISTGTMPSSDVLEFCGLCCAAVRLPTVLQHLQSATPLFPNFQLADDRISVMPTTRFQLPQQRLERIQRLFLRALGYHPDYGTKEIKRMFYSTSFPTKNEIDLDGEVHAIFRSMEQQMEKVLRDVTAAITHNNFFATSSDNCDDDGVTRVVSVSYTEKFVDALTGQDISTIDDPESYNANCNVAPSSLTMEGYEVNDEDVHASNSITNEHGRRQELDVARRAAILQQEILGELLSLRDEQRDEKLREANTIVDDVMQHILSLPIGSERISYISNLDPKTQRCMAMKKIWDAMLKANGNQPPTLQSRGF